tara:strand:+ start:642 stop:815 length:174 start_codon:yes stop_codon:yes gene_type:complete
MKKFNKMESNFICDALNYYVAHLEFVPGSYPMIPEIRAKKYELVNKVKKNMTKKQKV